jgi:hypothetical protein
VTGPTGPAGPIGPSDPVLPEPPAEEPPSTPPPIEPGLQDVDSDAPKTKLTHRPSSVGLGKHRRVAARFDFESSEANSTFECRLNSRDWKSCDSPLRVRVAAGDHTFRVRAIDAAGNADPTPAVHRWTVHDRG